MFMANIEKILSKHLFRLKSIVFRMFVIFITQGHLLFVDIERGFVEECFRFVQTKTPSRWRVFIISNVVFYFIKNCDWPIIIPSRKTATS